MRVATAGEELPYQGGPAKILNTFMVDKCIYFSLSMIISAIEEYFFALVMNIK